MLLSSLKKTCYFPMSTQAKKLHRASGLEACPCGRAQTKNCLPKLGPSFLTVRSTQGSLWTLHRGAGGGPWRTDFQNPSEAPLGPLGATADSAVWCSALVSLGASPVLSSRGQLEVCFEGSQTPLTTLLLLLIWTICEFCDWGSVFVTAPLDAFDAFSAGAPLETLGLKKASRLPCGGSGGLAEVFVTLLFFPFGGPEPDGNGLFFPKLVSAAPSGFRFSRFSSASWELGSESLDSVLMDFGSTFTRKWESFCCLPVNSGR